MLGQRESSRLPAPTSARHPLQKILGKQMHEARLGLIVTGNRSFHTLSATGTAGINFPGPLSLAPQSRNQPMREVADKAKRGPRSPQNDAASESLRNSAQPHSDHRDHSFALRGLKVVGGPSRSAPSQVCLVQFESRDMDRCSRVTTLLQRHRWQGFMPPISHGNRLDPVEEVEAGEEIDSSERQQFLRLGAGRRNSMGT